MRKLVLLMAALGCMGVLFGCGSSQPDEAKLKEELSKPPMRPKSQGVGQKKLQAAGGAPATAPTSGN